VPLTQLDLAACRSVSDIVAGMSKCSFGARMLGEVAATLSDWCDSSRTPFIVYDGVLDSPLGKLLELMVKGGWFRWLMRPDECKLPPDRSRCALVVGPFSERHADALFARDPGTTIYVNDQDLAAPGQVKDGHFPNAVFADPRLIMPILAFTIRERRTGNPESVADLVRHLRDKKYGGVADQFVAGADALIAMAKNRDCRRFLTLSGAMTVAQMSLVICELIDRDLVHAVTSTGALMAHGLVPGLGLRHYKHDPSVGDRRLAAQGLNRVTDTLEPETNFDQVDDIMSAVLDGIPGGRPISPRLLNAAIGAYLAEHHPGHRAILRSAHERGVPVFVPAFTDSELGNDVFVTNVLRERILGRPRVTMDLELDSAELLRLMAETPVAGIMTFGGGVPRNWTQNVAPLAEIYHNRLSGHGLEMPQRMFRYGCRVCPDRPHFGHLSGCTYEEGMSWRKFDPNGRFAEIRGDSTQVWPLLVKLLMDRQDEKN